METSVLEPIFNKISGLAALDWIERFGQFSCISNILKT